MNFSHITKHISKHFFNNVETEYRHLDKEWSTKFWTVYFSNKQDRLLEDVVERIPTDPTMRKKYFEKKEYTIKILKKYYSHIKVHYGSFLFAFSCQNNFIFNINNFDFYALKITLSESLRYNNIKMIKKVLNFFDENEFDFRLIERIYNFKTYKLITYTIGISRVYALNLKIANYCLNNYGGFYLIFDMYISTFKLIKLQYKSIPDYCSYENKLIYFKTLYYDSIKSIDYAINKIKINPLELDITLNFKWKLDLVSLKFLHNVSIPKKEFTNHYLQYYILCGEIKLIKYFYKFMNVESSEFIFEINSETYECNLWCPTYVKVIKYLYNIVEIISLNNYINHTFISLKNNFKSTKYINNNIIEVNNHVINKIQINLPTNIIDHSRDHYKNKKINNYILKHNNLNITL